MTINFNFQKYVPYLLTAMAVLLICWLLWRKDSLEPQPQPPPSTYDKIHRQAQIRIERLQKDSVAIRVLMAKKDASFDSLIQVRKQDDAKLKKIYEKIKYSNSNTNELDSVRRWIRAELENNN